MSNQSKITPEQEKEFMYVLAHMPISNDGFKAAIPKLIDLCSRYNLSEQISEQGIREEAEKRYPMNYNGRTEHANIVDRQKAFIEGQRAAFIAGAALTHKK